MGRVRVVSGALQVMKSLSLKIRKALLKIRMFIIQKCYKTMRIDIFRSLLRIPVESRFFGFRIGQLISGENVDLDKPKFQ